MDIFAQAAGLSFYVLDKAFELYVGKYSNGRAGIVVYTDTGEAYDKLTVNLPDDELDPVWEIFVKIFESSTDVKRIHEELLKLGIFERTMRTVAGGRVPHYAEVWRAAECKDRTHTHFHETAGDARPALLCADCQKRWGAAYQEVHDRIQSRDAARRLRGEKPLAGKSNAVDPDTGRLQ